MSVGKKPAFACIDGDAALHQSGLTYREWLIGMIAGGYAANRGVYEDHLFGEQAEMAVELADGIIAALDKETEDKGGNQ